jgi:hypothetical protein
MWQAREKGEGRREKGEGRREKGEGRREKGEGKGERGREKREAREGREKIQFTTLDVPIPEGIIALACVKSIILGSFRFSSE